MIFTLRSKLTAIAIAALISLSCQAADETVELPVRSGLLLWLDASSLSETTNPGDRGGNHDVQRVPEWRDRSGNHRDLIQPIEAMQPSLHRVGNGWTVRFDGVDEHLRCESVTGSVRSATIFLVAAPHSNPGEFRGLISANAIGQRDYASGFCIDLGPEPTMMFQNLNVEGRSFGGARDLMNRSDPFGTLHVLEAVIDDAMETVRLVIDGEAQGERPKTLGPISLDQWTVGARYYTNGPGAQEVRGPLACDLAEILVFDRVLSAEEASRVRDYLKSKYAALADAIPHDLNLQGNFKIVEKVADPPPIQMLIPGFTTRGLPVELTNVNNVRFREDGVLVTLGYNGDIHLLSDSDGDGLEETVRPFWINDGSVRGPIGMLLTPPGYSRGRGVFVASKGKVSLFVDRDGDDRADEEIIVATGWQEIPQNVDALGVAMDQDGAIYFGLGCANFANAYQVDDQGNFAYELHSERGTVQKVAPDFSKRETVCTGVRFPVAFGFNEHGDLFCTDQEGATWLANGNPLDELLHIQPGRHYGFPPRHPKYNPSVIDEPSTYDYGPQHQSTCGLIFNVPPFAGGRTFGPALWRGDAIVCGESRGKIWRTKLVRTDAGYLAATQLLACLQMLTVDACVAPNGDLVVACHSGPPDWGTGPTGIGKLFRIAMTDPEVARPTLIWAESPNEIRIAFDRPLDPSKLARLAEQILIQYGKYVRAGDRFENLVPPYAVVQRQLVEPRSELPVAGVSLTSDLRTIIVSTAAMRAPVHYAIQLPQEPTSQASDNQVARTELDVTLNGVQAEWIPTVAEGDSESWNGWLPHLDPQISRDLTAGSAQHDSLWAMSKRPGRLLLRTKLNVHHILRPAVQQGASIDYEWPREDVTVELRTSNAFQIRLDGQAIGTTRSEAGHQAQFTVSGDVQPWVELEIELSNNSGQPMQLNCTMHTNEDQRPRAIPLLRLVLPWVKTVDPNANDLSEPSRIAEIAGGNWGRGRKVFHSEAASCFKCHAMRGIGATIGPDLANLVHRDYASVLRDIVHPSYSINPDYIGHTVLMEGGEVRTGVLRNENGQLFLGDAEGRTTLLDRSQIQQMQPAKVSVMPTGLLSKLTPEEARDLMTYLLTPPPHMPLESPLQAPVLRTAAEVAAVLDGAEQLPSELKPLTAILVAGPKDHGPGEHDYPAWQVAWGQLLAAAPHMDVEMAWEFPTDDQMERADLLVFFQKGAWNDQRASAMDRFLARGGGAVYIHWAVNGDERVADFASRIGLASRGGAIKYRHGPLRLDLHNTDHPILRNLDAIQLYDESYWLLTGEVKNVTLLASSLEDGQPQPQIWLYEKGAGRVFVSIPGHYSWTFDDPIFRIVLLRGTAWAVREPVDRFNELVPLGARMKR